MALVKSLNFQSYRNIWKLGELPSFQDLEDKQKSFKKQTNKTKNKNKLSHANICRNTEIDIFSHQLKIS